MSHDASKAPSAEVALLPAVPGDAALLANLLELYIHDLSEYFDAEVDVEGRFGYPLAPYLEQPSTRFPFLIRVGGRVAGFAFAKRGSPRTDDPNDLDVAEFFVLRRHRRGGVGRRAAFALWDRLPGHWIVRVADANARALAFWRATVSAYTGQPLSERRVELPERTWHVLDFESRKHAAAP